ncbi:GatB/YqeY domain-containing protein [Lepidopterella palustris CBS 459.81]|uniref:Altered inheritance of mitochondria protein 41 n=1 Tax=Lepidopterella palustris CBS 459.81 TaxID=1314670 RepID=A0A8E2E8N8_9PEZI|nr:GatB/YqeY domain-containing protein [Lepidopterella palustris CBS 459.81]
MASFRNPFLRLPSHTHPTLSPLRLCHCRRITTTPFLQAPPPVLSRLRDDLKIAMRAKDAVRLSVLRNLLSEITNASKTNSPITTDLRLLNLLRQRIASSRTAASEFRDAGRNDVAEKEEAQISVMEEYAGGVETVGEEEVRAVVRGVVEEMRGGGGKVDLGAVLRKVTGEGGALDGRPVEKKEVVKIVKELLEVL